MRTLTDLIQFIRTNPPEGEFWSKSEWEIELSTAIPNWRISLRESANWDEVEKVRPRRYYDNLCDNLVAAGGLELAKRWFYSQVSDQKTAAKNWLFDNISKWGGFDQNMKNEILYECFNRFPGQPIEMVKEYAREIGFMLRDYDCGIHRGNVSHHPPPLPYGGDYVPSPQVEQLRSIIEDAGDEVYLEKVDEIIDRRERAWEQGSEFILPAAQHRIPHSLNGDERELIARLMKITRRSGYLPVALPPILLSSETPPIFVAYPELEEEDTNRDERGEDQILRGERSRPETISIEELLGVYEPRFQQIIIYERGIRWLGRKGFDEKWLSTVVLIHEIGHWITHQLPQPGVPTWPTDLYVLSEPDVHEGWAQLITSWIAAQVGRRFEETFERLNRNQSPPYHVFNQFKGESIDQVMASLEKLRLLQWPARLEDWKKAL